MSSYLQALKLIELRKKYHYSQSELGKYLQMSRAGYSQYELGKRTPTHHILLSLSQLYNIPIDELINVNLILSKIPSSNAPGIVNDAKSLHTLGIKCIKAKPKLDLSSLTESDAEFLINFCKLDSASRQRILLYIKACLKQQAKSDS